MDRPYPDLETLDQVPLDPGGQALTLAIGPWTIGVHGLEADLAAGLLRRWGGFARPGSAGAGDVNLFCAWSQGPGLGIGGWEEGEAYRLEGALVAGRPVVRSYNFCMAPSGEGDGNWKLVLGGATGEPPERTVENAVRCMVSRLALTAGGFAFHGAGVRRSGETWIYAGPSGAGKSTAVSLTAPCDSLGDDFAVALPGTSGWITCAVPFDNSEKATERPVEGLLPLGAILRLFQAVAGDPSRVELPAPVLRTASLLTSVMLPGLFVDLGDAAIENAGRFVSEGLFGHLHFHMDHEFVDRIHSFVSRERQRSAR